MPINSTEVRITALGEHIKAVYTRWRNNRQSAGIDDKWQRNWECYRRVANGTLWKLEEKDQGSSTFVSGKVKQKIIAAYSLIVDMVLQGGRIPFNLKESPEDQDRLENMPPEARAAVEQEIEKATSLIETQMDEGHSDRSMYKCVLSAAVFGVTYATGRSKEVIRCGHRPVAIHGVEDTDQVSPENLSWEYFEEKATVPHLCYVSPFSLYTDLEDSDLATNEGYVIYKHESAYSLRQLAKNPSFDKAAIERAISSSATAGTQSQGRREVNALAPELRAIAESNRNIEHLCFRGRVPRKVAEEYEKERNKPDNFATASLGDIEADGNEVEIICDVAANGEVIRMARSEPHQRNLFRAYWQEDLDGVTGSGVADDGEMLQATLTGLYRTCEKNAKLASNVLLGLREDLLENPEDAKTLKTGTILKMNSMCADVRQAFQTVVVPAVFGQLIPYIDMIDREGDLDMMIPRIQQGAEGATPTTAYEISRQLEMAGKYMGAVIRNIDEGIIEPLVTFFFLYNMADPDAQTGRGNFKVKAMGFSNYEDRLMRVNALQRFMQLLLITPETAAAGKFVDMARIIARAEDLDPDEFLKSDEELRQEAAARAQQQQAAMAAQQQQLEAKAQLDAAAVADKQDAAKQRRTQARFERERLDLERERAANERAKLTVDLANMGGNGRKPPRGQREKV